MARVNIDTNEMYDHGKALGFLFGSFLRGLLDGMEEFESVCADLEAKQKEEVDGLQRFKQDNGDCAACWCDTCEKLEQCAELLTGEIPDGIRPFPCVGCKEGMRFRPTDAEEGKCRDYIERGKV